MECHTHGTSNKLYIYFPQPTVNREDKTLHPAYLTCIQSFSDQQLGTIKFPTTIFFPTPQKEIFPCSYHNTFHVFYIEINLEHRYQINKCTINTPHYSMRLCTL